VRVRGLAVDRQAPDGREVFRLEHFTSQQLVDAVRDQLARLTELGPSGASRLCGKAFFVASGRAGKTVKAYGE
jgi:hypothetical protein